MSTIFSDLVQAQIDSLSAEIAEANTKRERAKLELEQLSKEVDRNEAKLEALSATLIAARQVEGGTAEKKRRVPPVAGVETIPTGTAKPKATEAILALVDKAGSASREELLALGSSIETTASNPRHIMQTIIYQLVKKKKLVDDNGRFRRTKPNEVD